MRWPAPHVCLCRLATRRSGTTRRLSSILTPRAETERGSAPGPGSAAALLACRSGRDARIVGVAPTMSETPARPIDPRLAQALELLAEAEKLTVPGDIASLGRAVANAEAAIKVIGAFVAATPTPEARNMLAGAWTRRGIVLLLLGSSESLAEAVR